jgi:predicted transcriptional regulator
MDYREPSVFGPADDETEEQALKQAEADVAAGRTVPHAEVVRWLRSWGTSNELPPPKSRNWQK